MSQILNLLGFCLVVLFHHTLSQPLPYRAELSSARLLSPRSGLASVYDGFETIYIFGGLFFDPDFNLIPYDTIHAYNITSDSISVVGKLPRTAYDGRAFHDAQTGDVFYLRGDGTFLWRYSPSSGETVSETEWFGGNAGNTLVFTEDRKFVSFGGLTDPTEIYEFDLTTGQQGLIGRLPLPSELSMGLYSLEEGISYIFAGEMGNRDPQLMIYDHSTMETVLSGISFPSWRHGDGSPVWTGESVYILGAVVDNGARGDGMIRFNQNSTGAEFIPIQGLADLLTSTSAVWVDRLRRIYIFGGYDNSNDDTDRIWWIDLGGRN